MTSCRYPNTTKKVVEGASLAVTLNSRVAVIGANGAGKSTLIKVLTGERLLPWCSGVLPDEHASLRIPIWHTPQLSPHAVTFVKTYNGMHFFACRGA